MDAIINVLRVKAGDSVFHPFDISSTVGFWSTADQSIIFLSPYLVGCDPAFRVSSDRNCFDDKYAHSSFSRRGWTNVIEEWIKATPICMNVMARHS